MRYRTLGVCVAVCAVFAGCGSDEPAGPAAVASVVVTPGVDTLDALGRTRQFSAVARDAAGNTLTGRTFTWSSTAGAVASVNSASGLVTAVANGSATIRASADGVIGAAQLVVAQAVAAVTVTPGTAPLTSLGATQQFTAVARDGLNNPIANPRFLWLSSDPAVATIDTLGRATARRAGAATITAAAEGIPGYAALTVTQATTLLAFRVHPPATTVAGDAFATAVQVEVRDAGGALVPDAQIPVTLAASTGSLKGTTTVNAINGIASFSGLFMEQAGAGYTITATSAALTQAISTAYAIAHAPPTAVAFVAPPANDTAGSLLGIVARIRDRFGNTATSATDVVRLRLVAAPAGGVLFGDTAVAAVAGVATFATANIHLAGAGYLLRAVTAGIDSVASAPFTITHSVAHHVIFPGPTFFSVTAGFDTFGPAFAIVDAFENAVPYNTHVVTLVLAVAPFPTQLLGSASASTYEGEGVFDGWRLNRPGGPYRVTTTSPGFLPGESLTVFSSMNPQSMTAGSVHTCVRAGVPICWGANAADQLGAALATASGDSVPLVGDFTENVFAISGGETHTCVLGGFPPVASCWGANSQGQLGSGAAGVGGATPVAVQGGLTWRAISAGGFHTCGIATDSTAYCWGDNANGQLGDDNAPNDRAFPAPLFRARKYIRIDAGREHTCAVAADSSAYCWGRGDQGQLGHGLFTASDTAVLVQAGAVNFTGLSSGDRHTCAIGLVVGADVYCWGADGSGQLGDGALGPDRATPALVSGGLVVANLTAQSDISGGASHTCALSSAGSGGHIYCWGAGGDGQLGPAGGASSAVPVIAMSGATLSFTTVAAGSAHSCAYAAGAASSSQVGMYCWGRNVEGQLGIGTRGPGTATPTRIIQ